MGVYNLSKMMEGDLFGVRDVGLTAWTIRWQTAGWGERDNMDVWVHVGVLVDYLGDGRCAAADMFPGRIGGRNFAINYLGGYLNGPSGNPSINDLRRSASIRSSATARLWLRSFTTSLATYPINYDWGALFGMALGGVWNSQTSYLCTEMAFQLICLAEYVAGYRYMIKGNGYPPVYLYRLNRAYNYGYAYRNADLGVMWNYAYIADLTKPWNMKRGCSAAVSWLYRTEFYV